MDYLGEDDEIPDYEASNDALDFLDNPNLFEMNMDNLFQQVTTQSPPHAFPSTAVDSAKQPLDTIVVGNFLNTMEGLEGLDTSTTEVRNPLESNDSFDPYSQYIRTQANAQSLSNSAQTHPPPIDVHQGNLVRTDPYPPGLDPNSLAHRHFGIKSYKLPKQIDPTFLYHGQGYTKEREDYSAEDLALSDEDRPKAQSTQLRENVDRSRNTQPPPIPYRTKPSNTTESNTTEQYPWIQPRRPSIPNPRQPTNRTLPKPHGSTTTAFGKPIIQRWKNPYERRAHETGHHSANAYAALPNQANPYQDNSNPPISNQDDSYLTQSNVANPYQLDNDVLDVPSADDWEPFSILQDYNRTNSSTPTTNIPRHGSRIPVPVQRDSTWRVSRERAQTTSQIDSNNNLRNRRDPRGKAEPINRISSKTNLNKNNRRAVNQLAPGTYAPLPAPPPSWTSTRGKTFVYDISGELQNGTYYTCKEIEDFLYQNPRRGNMTLWIQRLPADSAARYPYSESRRCRFLHCFMSNGTINQGHYRIAFDELTGTLANHDPMHNAGYVHLYCFEKYLDFPKIVAELNVQVDQRVLPMEPTRRNGLLYQTNNRMIVSTQGELNVATDFVDYCNQQGHAPPGYPHQSTRNINTPGNKGHEGTLVHRLWEMKIRHDPGTIKSAENRGAKASTGISHMGNLEIENYERGRTRKRENQTIRTLNPKKGGRRRLNPETTIREERAKKRRRLQEENMQLGAPLQELQAYNSYDDVAEEDEDDEADAFGDRDSLFDG
ncbi:hypothetical protein MMC11_005922 [Xylographa trunciseda]|nr:hypothetical protein [Xylographa trunciseda]